MMDVQPTREGTDDLWEAIFSQRAIRRWEQRPVDQALLWRVLEAGTKAPSGSNLQPWRFVVVQDDERRAAIAALLRERFEGNPETRQRMERGAQSQSRGERLMLAGARRLNEHLDSAPVFIIPCLYGITSPTSDVDTLLAGSSIYLAVQNMLLAARALGLGTVLTTFQRLIESDLCRLLELPDGAKPVALIPLGYPDANFGPTSRRPVEEVVYWDGWGATRAHTA